MNLKSYKLVMQTKDIFSMMRGFVLLQGKNWVHSIPLLIIIVPMLPLITIE